MGHKVNPNGLRYGIYKDWQSRWYAPDKQTLVKWIQDDNIIRKTLALELKNASISKFEIERTKSQIVVFIFSARIGMVLGQGGANVDRLILLMRKAITDRKIGIRINAIEIKNPDTDAQIIASTIALQISNRASYRSAQKVAIRKALRAGVKGIKTKTGGRLGEADMARVEGYSEGSVPLATLRSDLDYAHAEADTTFGKIGVKVWVYKGEILPGSTSADRNQASADQGRNNRDRNDRDRNRDRGYNNRRPNNNSRPAYSAAGNNKGENN